MSDGQTLAQMHPAWKTVYDFLWLLGEAIFMFLPVAICWSTVKKMGGTPVLGIVLGVTLVSPQLMNSYLLGQQTPEVWNFGWFVIQKVGYQAQVIPSILAGMALGWIETRLKKIVPDYLYLVVVPVVSLLLAVFLAHALIGPFGRMIGDGVAWAVKSVMTGSFAPVGAAGDDRRAPDHAGYRHADDPEHGWHPGVAADCAVQHRAGLGGARHHHHQPQGQRA
jgi:PTS system trehalose-specific IIC component